MTIIKLKPVTSERHGENVRRYLNGKDALARDGWNIFHSEHWYAEMDRTRELFGHNEPAKRGTKNTIMYHQILAFLPEECSVNGGKMTPEHCMRYAMEYVAKRYPNNQVVFALHEEKDKQGKRYAVHMAINRSDLMTGKRIHGEGGKNGYKKRVATVREMDSEWGLKQVEEGKPNSLIHNRSPRDAEKAIIEDDRYSYKNNLREIVASVIKSPNVRSLGDFKKWIEEFGGEVDVRDDKVYVTDTDVRETGNPKCTFDIGKLDGRFTLQEIQKSLETKSVQQGKEPDNPKAVYLARIDKALAAYREAAKQMGADTPKLKLPKRPDPLVGDRDVTDRILAASRAAEKIRSKTVPKRGGGEQLPGRGGKGSGGGTHNRARTQSQTVTRKNGRGGGERSNTSR